MARERKFTKEDLYEATKELLLQVGYEGFNFSILSRELNVSRGAIYKYFRNKDHLITNYMVYEMEKFVEHLTHIGALNDFDIQFESLLQSILANKDNQRIREMAIKLPEINGKYTEENRQKINSLHLEMYHSLQSFVSKGKQQKKIPSHLPDSLILGFIFNTIDLPNHERIPTKEWIEHVKYMLSHGIVIDN